MDIHTFANVKAMTLGIIPGSRVVRMTHENTVLWEIPKGEPFYVEDISGSNNVLTISAVKVNNYDAPAITVEKSTDGINWTTMGTTSSTTDIEATIPANGKLYLRAVTNAWYQYIWEFEDQWTSPIIEGYNKISTSNNCNVGGNIMSLLYGNDYWKNVVPRSHQDSGYYGTSYNYYTFRNLFINNTRIIDASKLILPATSPNSYGYAGMFQGCSSLTTAPALPATTMSDHGYEYMFQNCSALTTAPELPATTLNSYCYSYMFSRCTALTNAPELPVTTLHSYCYQSMFSHCTALTTAPDLPATTLATFCYSTMFYGCSSLNYIKCLATNISASSCLNVWVGGVAASGVFVKAANMTSWRTGESGIPSGWTVRNAS